MKQMVRTIYPVGCASFITEEFYDHESGSYFRVIYDCGIGKRQGGKVRLSNLIDNSFRFGIKGTANFLFLSHFDSDHINGLNLLIEKQYITKDTISFLPLLDLAHLDFIEALVNSKYRAMVLALVRIGSQIVFINNGGANNNLRTENDNNQEKINLIFHRDNNPFEFVKPENDHWQTATDYITNILNSIKVDVEAERMKYKDFKIVCNKVEHVQLRISVQYFDWEYLPFYIQPQWVLDSFYETVEKEMPGVIAKISSFPIKWTKGEQKKLKDLYQNHSKDSRYENVKNVTRINMNSMMLLSQSVAKDLKSSILSNSLFENFLDLHPIRVDVATCVYTADVSLSKLSFFVVFENFVHKNATNPIGLLQIPHHGSVYCYNQKLYSSTKLHPSSCFVNGDIHSTNPRFEPQILNDSKNYGIDTFIINDFYPLIQLVDYK